MILHLLGVGSSFFFFLVGQGQEKFIKAYGVFFSVFTYLFF